MNRKSLLTWVGGAALTGSLVAGGFTLSDVFAQTPAQSPQPTQPGQPAQPAQPDPQTLPPLREMKLRGHRGAGGKLDLVGATATATGLTVAEVRDQLAAGKSPAQIAQERGKAAQDVIDAALTQVKTQLDKAVAEGTLTQAEADTRLTQATEKLTILVNQAGLHKGKGPGGAQRGGFDLVGTTAEVTGLTQAEVQTQLAAGKSLAQIAQERGKTADDILGSLRTKAQEQLNTRLEAARSRLNTPGGR